jgi:uncharacterized protein with HEPN domain
MSQRDDAVPVRHMLEHAKEALSLVPGRTREELRSHRMLQLALTRLVEIVGEAAGRVSPETQSRFPAVPWREAVATRHRITHGYDVVATTSCGTRCSTTSLPWSPHSIQFSPTSAELLPPSPGRDVFPAGALQPREPVHRRVLRGYVEPEDHCLPGLRPDFTGSLPGDGQRRIQLGAKLEF